MPCGVTAAKTRSGAFILGLLIIHCFSSLLSYGLCVQAVAVTGSGVALALFPPADEDVRISLA